MSEHFDLRIEWLEAPGVSTPELAATWARYEMWVKGNCVTQVESADSTLRRSVYGSLYPLAEWVASNWWALNASVRPSSVETHYWTWSNLRTERWLKYHNTRGAGDGMAWPNLTLVPEGSVTRIRWFADSDSGGRAVRFVSAGVEFINSREVMNGLARIVESVLRRLAEAGLPKTDLADDWAELGRLDDEEKDFCVTVARLGLDPFAIDDLLAAEIVDVAGGLPDELLPDFFDNADSAGLAEAAEWMRKATRVATRASGKAKSDLGGLGVQVSTGVGRMANNGEQAWELGYRMARRVRQELGTQDTGPFDISPWLTLGVVNADSAGIPGLGIVDQGRCGLVLGGSWSTSRQSRLFAQARALGRALVRPDQRLFLLSAAKGYDERVARAFAAELLAPAAGINECLKGLGRQDDVALEAVADRFGVSPLVVRHQYDNQLAHIT